MIHDDDDDWPPYSSEAWQEFAKKESFNSKLCGPEYPQGNGLAQDSEANACILGRRERPEDGDIKVAAKP